MKEINHKCEECNGTGRILLLISEVDCEACSGSTTRWENPCAEIPLGSPVDCLLPLGEELESLYQGAQRQEIYGELSDEPQPCDFLPASKLAAKLGVSLSHIQLWYKRGDLRAVSSGGLLSYSVRDAYSIKDQND